MTLEQALEAIKQAIDVALRKGAYCREDTKVINTSLDIIEEALTKKQEDTKE